MFMPFTGIRTRLNIERILVEEIVSYQSLKASDSGSELCGSSPEAFRVDELIAEIELDQVLHTPDGEDSEALESAYRCIIATNTDVKEGKEAMYHNFTSMVEFIEKVEDLNICRNFLDGKDMNAGTPVWAKPLIDSTIAWERTMHLRFLKQASMRNNDLEVEIMQEPPKVIHSRTLSSQR
ncbi:hypothetical protein JVT61DRAFT_1656 [Boletus reticuloceps]|uniref:Uncharacterized protein n=1 Tax=Boletus reticuloceps TaxID=495285 RepID=A0A8I2YRR7_9AGAM|nr:hypothetical protein JVT61DRAFT_1656 [Boletus reticuloceps]